MNQKCNNNLKKKLASPTVYGWLEVKKLVTGYRHTRSLSPMSMRRKDIGMVVNVLTSRAKINYHRNCMSLNSEPDCGFINEQWGPPREEKKTRVYERLHTFSSGRLLRIYIKHSFLFYVSLLNSQPQSPSNWHLPGMRNRDCYLLTHSWKLIIKILEEIGGFPSRVPMVSRIVWIA